jgi:hypothetical protein
MPLFSFPRKRLFKRTENLQVAARPMTAVREKIQETICIVQKHTKGILQYSALYDGLNTATLSTVNTNQSE